MPDDAPAWMTEIDHTGDIGIELTAATLDGLFERAAEGMFRVLTDLSSVRPTDATPITVEGPDLDALMVRWLSELNYRHIVDGQLFSTFDVSAIDTENGVRNLTATIRGEAIDPERHTVYTEIKAITFHGLDVHETDTGWAAQVIFDM